jgi:KDO2-lipid IV(A) lauroyltransferase
MKKISYYCLYALWYVLSLLPLRVHYVLSDLIYIIVYRLLGYRRRVVRSNLESSFPEKSTEELRAIERGFYHCLCDYFVESVKMMTMSRRQMRRRMVFKGAEEVDKCIEEGQSCVMYMGHTFNWEWIATLPMWVTPKAQCGQLYHALENEAFDRLFKTLRQRWGAVSIALTDILRKTIEYKRQGQPTVLGYVSDQVPHWNNIHHWCQFLNHDTPVMTGTERIARKNRQAMFYIDIRRPRRGYYEAEFRLITRHPEQMAEYEPTDIYHQMLEETIRRQPELWLWSHNRWKRTREEFNRRFKVVDGKVIEILKD